MNRHICAVLFGGVLVLLLLAGGAFGADGWWNESWQYRRAITINNENPHDLFDYQVKVVVPRFKGMNYNFSDIRFTYKFGDKEREIPYWIENFAPENATVWVKVPCILKISNTTIYMYYGNPSAQSESNGTATFLFFDDFSTDTSSNYAVDNLFQQGGSISYDSTNKRLELTTSWVEGGTAGHNVFYYKGQKFDKDVLVGSTIHFLDGGIDMNGNGRSFKVISRYVPGGSNPPARCAGFWEKSAWAPSEQATISKDSRGDQIINHTPYDYTEGETYTFRLGSVGQKSNFYINDTFILSATSSTGMSNGYVGWETYAANIAVDDIYVAKYTESEPTVKIGVEQSQDFYISLNTNKANYSTGDVVNLVIEVNRMQENPQVMKFRLELEDLDEKPDTLIETGSFVMPAEFHKKVVLRFAIPESPFVPSGRYAFKAYLIEPSLGEVLAYDAVYFNVTEKEAKAKEQQSEAFAAFSLEE